MNKSKKTIILLIIAILCVTFACIAYFFPAHPNGYYMPNNAKSHEAFVRDINELTYVGNTLLNSEYDYIRSDYSNEKILCSKENDNSYDTVTLEVWDTKLKQNIDYLKEKNYFHIVKSNNYVEFVYWENYNSHLSFVYCQSGSPNIEMGENDVLYAFEGIPQSNWSYYKHIDDI